MGSIYPFSFLPSFLPSFSYQSGGTEDLEFCDEILVKVSRSFAAVIRQLRPGLCVEIAVFYLALRALDTIEDDMEAFAHDPKMKVRHLQNFYEEGLENQNFTMTGVGKVRIPGGGGSSSSSSSSSRKRRSSSCWRKQ